MLSASTVNFLSVAVFLVESLLQDAGAIVAPELFGPCDQAAVARDLIMLGGLCGVDQSLIQHRLVRDFAGDLVGFLDDAVDRRGYQR